MKLSCTILFFFFYFTAAAQRMVNDTVNVYFDFDSANPSPDQEISLKRHIQEWLSAHGGVQQWYISGYTDSVGSTQYNMRLSGHRALSIKSILESVLPVVKVNIEAFGERFAGNQPDSTNRKAAIIARFALPAKPSEIRELAADTVVSLPNVQFVEDQAYPTSASEAALSGYVSMLKHIQFKRMEVVGYYNYYGKLLKPDDPRYILSERRAKFLADYFIEQGLDSAKISFRGAGNSRMLVETPTSVDDQRKNIRAELILYSLHRDKQ